MTNLRVEHLALRLYISFPPNIDQTQLATFRTETDTIGGQVAVRVLHPDRERRPGHVQDRQGVRRRDLDRVVSNTSC